MMGVNMAIRLIVGLEQTWLWGIRLVRLESHARASTLELHETQAIHRRRRCVEGQKV